MPIRARNDVVLVRRLPEPTESEGGIVLPSSAREKPQLGLVVSAGPRSGVRDGELVMFGKFDGHPTIVDNEELQLLRAHHLILAID